MRKFKESQWKNRPKTQKSQQNRSKSVLLTRRPGDISGTVGLSGDKVVNDLVQEPAEEHAYRVRDKVVELAVTPLGQMLGQFNRQAHQKSRDHGREKRRELLGDQRDEESVRDEEDHVLDELHEIVSAVIEPGEERQIHRVAVSLPPIEEGDGQDHRHVDDEDRPGDDDPLFMGARLQDLFVPDLTVDQVDQRRQDSVREVAAVAEDICDDIV